MRLTFLFQPVEDLAGAVAHYLDLGWEESWREGANTVALRMPDVEVELMIDDAGGWGPAGPMYLVDDLDAWLAAHPNLSAGETRDIPGSRVAEISAPGHAYYVFAMDGDGDADLAG